MKRLFPVLFGVLLLNNFAFAQLGGVSQRGKATQEMKTGGLSAAHSNIPLDSTVKIINTVTGKEIEVTITGRISASPGRIVDLSPAAWEALEMTPDTVVRLIYSPPPAPRARQQDEPADEPEIEEPEEAHWVVVRVRPELAPAPEWEVRIISDGSGEIQTFIESGNIVQEQPDPPEGVKIIPCLPPADSGKIYRLQVGAFAKQEAADGIAQRLRAAGFEAALEENGSLHRVLAVGIRAADVSSAARTLGSAGFAEIWVRE